MTISCEAKVTYRIQWNGTPDNLVALVNSMHIDDTSYPLDSYDLGDAMGYLIELSTTQGPLRKKSRWGTLKTEMVQDSFVWEGLTETAAHMLEAVCKKCKETFNPDREGDLEHVFRADGQLCEGQGELKGEYQK